MATSTLRAEDAQANPISTINATSMDIQSLIGRLLSLSHAIDDAADDAHHESSRNASLARIIDFVNMIKETASQARDQAESIEILSSQLQRQTS